MRVGIIGHIESLSPIYDRSPIAMGVQNILFRGFLGWAADGSLRTDWATEVPSLRGQTFRGNATVGAYTVTLRPDAKWSDGTALNNDDFMFTYRVMLHPLFKTGHLWWTGPIRGFKEAGPALTFEVARSTTHDSLDLFPLPRQLLENMLNRDAVHFSEHLFNTGAPLGDGPYKVTKRTADRIEMERNALYAPRVAHLTRVVLQFYATSDDAWSALNRGAVDILDDVPLDSLGNLAEGGAARIELTPGPRLVALTFNTSRPPFDDVHLRRALAQSLDRKTLVQNVGKNNAIATDSWMQPTRAGYLRSFVGYRGDVERARTSLLASEWAIDGNGRITHATAAPRGDDPPPDPPGPADASPPARAETEPTAAGAKSTSSASVPSANPRAESSNAPGKPNPSAAARSPAAQPSGVPPDDKADPGASPVSVLYDADSADMKSAMESLQKSWDRLGVKMVAVGRPHASYLAEMRQGSYSVALQEMMVFPWAEPAAFFAVEGIPTPANNFKGDNVSRWSSAESKKLLARIAAEPFPAAVPDALHQQERLVVRDVPMLPLYFTPLAVAHRVGLEGLRPRTFGSITWNIEEWSWK